MISVIIPVHNHAQTLARAVKSALSQNVADLEIIIVDDGSTDDVAASLSEVDAQRVTLLRQEKQGPAAARNAGIKASHGDLIAFLDADDFWLPEKLNAQVTAMNQTGRRFSFCGSQVVDDYGNILVTHLAREGDGEFSTLVWGNRFPTPSVVAERALLDQCGLFDESLHTGEDWDLWLRLAAEGPGACVTAPLVAVTGEARWQADEHQLRNYAHSTTTILDRIQKLAVSHPELDSVLAQRRKIKSWHYASLAKTLLRAHKLVDSLRYAALAVLTSTKGLSYLMPGKSGRLADTTTNGSADLETSTNQQHFDVSVLIRTYNRAAMLGDALESALKQTLPAKEIVIIDDGSTDETAGLVETYQAKYPQIRYVRTDNRGAGSAARRGVEECRGTYIAFLDSDDVWLPDHLRLAAQQFKRNRSTIMVFTGYGLIGAGGEPLVNLVHEPVLSNPRQQFLLKRIIVQPTRTVVSRQAVIDVGGYPEIPAGEDWALSVLIAAQFPDGVVQSSANTALLRMHGSQSFARPLALQQSLLEATDYTFSRLPAADSELKPKVISTHLLHCAIFLWQAGETREAWRSLFRAIKVRAASVGTREFVSALARLVVPSSIGKLIRQSKRSRQRDRSVNFGPELAQPRPRR